ncbi:MAG: beta-galactosidase [Armatimonadota bacterium]|nr:beta-galactosidase [Armatimonadota bacterium]MDW8143375.1 beta-galactosidase [Armatimonadota bacterium]
MFWVINAVLLLNSFESRADVAKVQPNNASIVQVSSNATHGRFALRVEFKTVQYPNIYFRVGQAFDKGDWREFGGLAVDVTNLESEPVSLFIRIDDDFAADGRVHCRTGRTSLPPKRTVTVVMPFQVSIPPGMRGGPPLLPNSLTMTDTYGSDLDLSHIVAFQLFLVSPQKPIALTVDNIRLVPKPNFHGIVDRYGQYAHGDWKGKVKSDGDLRRQLQEEEKWLKFHLPFSDRDEFGGWLKGPKLKATGFFRAAYVVDGMETEPPANLQQGRGRWWLVTPTGRLFFSLGVDCVRYDESSPLDNREYLFSWLPEPNSPLAQFIYRWHFLGYTRWVNFYAMNLFRKYGEDWQRKWLDVTVKRLLSWGFNTIGNWSSAEVFRARKIPYVVPIHISAHTYFQTAWQRMPDVFDGRFSEAVEQTIASAVREWKEDPWCIGYFVDNELSWSGWGSDLVNRYDLPRRVLANDGNLPSKREFVRLLRAKYGEIERLNEAWKIKVASWEDLLSRPIGLPEQMTDECVADLSEFLTHFARRYFSVVRDALKRHAPNQLYLGCRFAPKPMEVVKVAAEFCDVVSFNIYARTVDENEWAFTNTLGRPCIIGEFHFGALDRGMFHTGLVAVENQAERGKAYQAYVRSVWKLPAFVGCHWFQYVDEPLTGRFDGENYNIGLVSVVDYPYWELVEAARRTNGQVYRQLTSIWR